jgi:hypothetical protein
MDSVNSSLFAAETAQPPLRRPSNDFASSSVNCTRDDCGVVMDKVQQTSVDTSLKSIRLFFKIAPHPDAQRRLLLYLQIIMQTDIDNCNG